MQPSDPIFFRVGESRTITCTLDPSTDFIGWNVALKSGNTVSVNHTKSNLKGVTAVLESRVSTLTLNTSNTSIISVTCVAGKASPIMFYEQEVFVTIYGKYIFNAFAKTITNYPVYFFLIVVDYLKKC